MYKTIKEAAFKNAISFSEEVRRMVKKQYKLKSKKDLKEPIGIRLLRMAKDAEKKGISGPPDLASNMDKYLYGK